MSTTALRNAYLEKTATTERPCYICMKMTTKVLTAKDGGDFFYVCTSHLQDPGFAKGEGYPPVPTPDAIAAVAAIKKKRAEAEKKKQGEAAAPATKSEEETKSHAAKFGSAVLSGLGSVATKAATSVSAFINDEEATKARIQAAELERQQAEARKRPAYWMLHRDIFYLRQNEAKKKNAKKSATETLDGLSFPKVPGGR
ncbi:VPS4-associated protein 1 [Gamsiella multidivaricata]|uniref:VPS4-associated protein 1 n=1 Tax=Gamsiella multidivaricata TaxID=101098 RepID=UPI00221F9BEC|nr:VPS4-associated protein 1 [Gamsiella multidivaricata]KAG0369475.1 hypothetical protein BGZ54_009833 [Gamsiella multidivaricata]KAI7829497.1 VPS4-associated protein 1 [Gamsiella multidivaricata]